MQSMLKGAFGFHTQTFSREEAANILAVSVDQVKIWIQDGTIPTVKILGMVRIKHQTLFKAVQAEALAGIFHIPASTLDLLTAGDKHLTD